MANIKYLNTGPISGDLISSLVSRMGEKSDTGGHSLFLGQVRADEYDGKKVMAIEYSAYEPMVEAEAGKIIKIVLEKHPDVKSVIIIHSVGTVSAGEISLLVSVSAGHRKQAMEACSMTVELIKENLPVWKKEISDDESHTWK